MNDWKHPTNNTPSNPFQSFLDSTSKSKEVIKRVKQERVNSMATKYFCDHCGIEITSLKAKESYRLKFSLFLEQTTLLNDFILCFHCRKRRKGNKINTVITILIGLMFGFFITYGVMAFIDDLRK
jgi:hypothetical protein